MDDKALHGIYFFATDGISTLGKKMKEQERIGKWCWQAISQVKLRHGVLKEYKYENQWLLYLVRWDDGSTSWERITNIAVEDLEDL